MVVIIAYSDGSPASRARTTSWSLASSPAARIWSRMSLVRPTYLVSGSAGSFLSALSSRRSCSCLEVLLALYVASSLSQSPLDVVHSSSVDA